MLSCRSVVVSLFISALATFPALGGSILELPVAFGDPSSGYVYGYVRASTPELAEVAYFDGSTISSRHFQPRKLHMVQSSIVNRGRLCSVQGRSGTAAHGIYYGGILTREVLLAKDLNQQVLFEFINATGRGFMHSAQMEPGSFQCSESGGSSTFAGAMEVLNYENAVAATGGLAFQGQMVAVPRSAGGYHLGTLETHPLYPKHWVAWHEGLEFGRKRVSIPPKAVRQSALHSLGALFMLPGSPKVHRLASYIETIQSEPLAIFYQEEGSGVLQRLSATDETFARIRWVEYPVRRVGHPIRY